MFRKKNEKLETLKDMIGSRAAYLETSQMLELDKREKDIFLRASIEVKKKKPNTEIIDQAYTILANRNLLTEPEESIDEEQIKVETTNSNLKETTQAPNDIYELKDKDISQSNESKNQENSPLFCSNCGNKLDANAKFCSKCGTTIFKASHTINNNIDISSIKTKPIWKKVLVSVLLVISLIVIFVTTIDIVSELDPNTRIENEARSSGISVNELRDTMWLLHGDKIIAQNRRNENIILGMLLILIIGGVFIAYLWRTPLDDVRMYEEQADVELASARRRVGAYFIDFLPIMLLVSQFNVPLLSQLVVGFYLAYMLSRINGNGQTIGYKIMGIKAIKENGENINIKEAILFALILILTVIISPLYFFNKKRKLIHNYATNTIVIMDK